MCSSNAKLSLCYDRGFKSHLRSWSRCHSGRMVPTRPDMTQELAKCQKECKEEDAINPMTTADEMRDDIANLPTSYTYRSHRPFLMNIFLSPYLALQRCGAIWLYTTTVSKTSSIEPNGRHVDNAVLKEDMGRIRCRPRSAVRRRGTH